MAPTPKKIKLVAGDDTLSIQWSDGHASVYGYRYLRERCPCATCTDKPPGGPEPSAFPILGVKPLKPESAEAVGRYAVQFHWSDNHSSGIYSFEYLRDMCPCAKCASQRTVEAKEAP